MFGYELKKTENPKPILSGLTVSQLNALQRIAKVKKEAKSVKWQEDEDVAKVARALGLATTAADVAAVVEKEEDAAEASGTRSRSSREQSTLSKLVEEWSVLVAVVDLWFALLQILVGHLLLVLGLALVLDEPFMKYLFRLLPVSMGLVLLVSESILSLNRLAQAGSEN